MSAGIAGGRLRCRDPFHLDNLDHGERAGIGIPLHRRWPHRRRRRRLAPQQPLTASTIPLRLMVICFFGLSDTCSPSGAQSISRPYRLVTKKYGFLVSRERWSAVGYSIEGCIEREEPARPGNHPPDARRGRSSRGTGAATRAVMREQAGELVEEQHLQQVRQTLRNHSVADGRGDRTEPGSRGSRGRCRFQRQSPVYGWPRIVRYSGYPVIPEGTGLCASRSEPNCIQEGDPPCSFRTMPSRYGYHPAPAGAVNRIGTN